MFSLIAPSFCKRRASETPKGSGKNFRSHETRLIRTSCDYDSFVISENERLVLIANEKTCEAESRALEHTKKVTF